MTAVNGTNLFTNTFNTIYDVISGCVAGSVNGVYASYPDKNFPGYPICIVNSADVSRDRLTAGSKYLSNYGINVGIVLYSKAMITIDQLSDKIISGLSYSDSSSTGLYASGLTNMSIGETSSLTQTFGEDRVHSKTFGVTFNAN